MRDAQGGNGMRKSLWRRRKVLRWFKRAWIPYTERIHNAHRGTRDSSHLVLGMLAMHPVVGRRDKGCVMTCGIPYEGVHRSIRWEESMKQAN